MAQKLGCRHIFAVATSVYTKTMFLRLGYQLQKEVQYRDYVDADTNEKPFVDPPEPHYSAALMVKPFLRPK